MPTKRSFSPAVAGVFVGALALSIPLVIESAKAGSKAVTRRAADENQRADIGVQVPWNQNDWAFLEKYKDANKALAAPATGENRVVFMGDSITEGWGMKAAPPAPDRGNFFPGKSYINRGISGQTTPQMLVRFRQDVIDLKPKVVVILAGINDIAGNTGPETQEQIAGYLTSMAELARANHIRVVLCSVLPAIDFPWHRGLEPAPRVHGLNAWIKDYAAENKFVYVDYYSSMAAPDGGMKPDLASDGVHPVKAGYDIMAPLAEAGIQQALRNPLP
jgi:acyl-CoA thioesterase-1